MAWWWRLFISKKAKKKKKGKIVDKLQRKLKMSSEDKSNDTISKKKSGPQKVPLRSINVRRRHHTHPLSSPLLGLHPPSDNHLNSEISATSKLGSTRGSKPRHVSNPIAPLSRNDNNSGIMIHDPRDFIINPYTPLLHGYENGNKTTSVACNDKLLTTSTQKSLIPSTKATPQLHSNEILPKLSKRGVTQLLNLKILRRSGFWSPTDNTRPSSSRSPTRRTFGPDQQVLNSGFYTSKPYLDIDSRHYSILRSVHNIGHDLVGGGLKRDAFWTHNRFNSESSPITSPGKTSSNLNFWIQSIAVNPLNPLATHNGCLFPTSYSIVQASSPHSPGSGILTRPSKWKKGRFLGQGTFGKVFVGFNSDSGMMCAMKEVTLCPDDPKSLESAKQLHQEVALLSNLQHPNIVRFYGSEMVGDKLYIYLEYAAGGSIYTLLQQYGRLGESAIRSYTAQILFGLAYLHAKCIVHRDIKGANILVDPNGTVKLADFGMAKYISGHPCQFSLKGSPHWMAPEIVINPSDCDLSVDIWSLGCTILEMATTKPPWSQYEGVAALYKLGNTEEIPLVPNYLSEEGKDFVNLCLQRDPESRPSAAQLLLHPFVQNFQLERSIRGIGPAYLHSKASDINLSGNSSGSSHMHSPRNIRSGSSSPLLGTSGSGAISFYQAKFPICSPSGSFSSLCTCGDTGIMPLHQTKKPTFSHEALGVIQIPQNVSVKMYFSPICHPIFASLSSSMSLGTGGSGVIPYNQSNKQLTCSHERIQRLQNSYALMDTTFKNDFLENDNRKNNTQGGGDSTQSHDDDDEDIR